jgi:ABC-2 type transport system permease protein
VGTMLFVREEAEILLHRPVRAEEVLRAKAAVLIAFALLLALALNAAGLVTSWWNKGNAPWFPLAHALTTLMLMVFSTAATVLVYNVCLRWFGRERFENLITLVQMALSVVMVLGSQLVPRVLGADALQHADLAHGWPLLLPPVWFGALDMLLCGVGPAASLLVPAAFGVGLTALLSWLAFHKLGAAYGVGLMALQESAPAASERRGPRRLPRLLQKPPLRWWLRDPIERQAFLLVSAYLLRDRETKLKIYPSLAPLVIMPVVMAVGPGRGDREGPRLFLGTFALAYAAIVPIQALMLLRRSEQWRAAALFRCAPLPHWTPVFHGARKAVLCWLALPALLVAAGILAALQGSWMPFALAVPALVCTLFASCVPAITADWLPLALPNSDQRASAIGCVVIGAVIIAAMALGGLAQWMDSLGWLWPFLGATVLLGVVLQRLLMAALARRRWRAAET